MASYFAVCFGALQIADIIIDRFKLNPIIINYFLFGIGIGFLGLLFFFYISSSRQEKLIAITTKKSFYSLIVITLIFILSISNIFLFRQSSLGDVREKAYTEGFAQIDQYIEKEDFIKGFEIAKSIFQQLPDDSLVLAKLDITSIETTINTVPKGSEVFLKGVDDQEWEYLGVTPLTTRLPRGYFYIQLSKSGYADYKSLTNAGLLNRLNNNSVEIELVTNSERKTNMVRIPGGNTRLFVSELGDLNVINLKPYWIDQFEVTNSNYQKFVDENGYNDENYWNEEILNEEGERIFWDKAMEIFTDQSGLNGPSTWMNGTYPEGQQNFPVTGISWYEAKAYAKWAGKQLPTIYHWYKAAIYWGESSVISPRSNFSGVPSEVGKYEVLSSYGCFDMAGNAREWGNNSHKNGNKSIFGGGYDDEAYFFTDNFSQHPYNRYKTNGFRCVIIPENEQNYASADTLIQTFTRDFYNNKPISDELFNVYHGMFQYDPLPVNETVVENKAINRSWTKRVVGIDAAYNNEKLELNIYTPANVAPPYKTIIYVPGSNAITTRNSKNFTGNNFGFLLRSGYAVIHPIYKGTYERGYPEFRNYVENTSKTYSDQMIMMVKDYSRAIDYVESKDEFLNEIYYYGISWGGMLGPLFLANENRIKGAIWQVAGLGARDMRPEANPLTYLTRIDRPVLMLNGKYDQYFPYETSQLPMYDLLSLIEPRKKMVTYESAHSPPRGLVRKEILSWLEKFE